MAVESDADRLEFFNTGEFAVTANFPLAGSPAINGIMDEPSVLVEPGDTPIRARRRTFHCRASDVPGLTVGMTLWNTPSGSFKIIDWEYSGDGMIMLYLSLL